MRLWINTAFFAGLLAAVASLASPAWALDAAPPVDQIAAPADILTVPPELEARFQRRVMQRARGYDERLQMLVDFIFDREGVGLTYDDSRTRTVGEVFQTGKANCLSFTMLFVALARDAGLDARAEEVGQVFTWSQNANTFFEIGHVNARVRIGSRTWNADLDGSVIYAPYGATLISDQRLIAHFYNNRGVELMTSGRMEDARRALQQAIDFAPDLANAWNTLGVLGVREGDSAGALQDFKTALKIDDAYAPTLSNLIGLYRHAGDDHAADAYVLRLRRIQSRDPFRQYLLATEDEQRGRYPDAVSHYRKAIRLFDGAHQFHFGLARTYFLMGNDGGARRELTRALALGRSDEGLAKRYQAKLDSLRRWSQQAASNRGSDASAAVERTLR